ncbi:MAG: esterase-like activity of phytase family protein, partial [Fimbriimonadaceae bacterium]
GFVTRDKAELPIYQFAVASGEFDSASEPNYYDGALPIRSVGKGLIPVFPKIWLYALEKEGNAIGELTTVNENQFLVIERDGAQGPEAETKKVFLISLGEGTQVEKELLVDLLEIDNPQGLGGFEPGTFRFPFTTIEAVEIIDERTLILCNDNNFPFSTGREPGVAEDTEFIVIRLPEPLDWTPPSF